MQLTAHWIARRVKHAHYTFIAAECSECGHRLKRHQKAEDVDTCPGCKAKMIKEDKKTWSAD